MFRSFKIFLLYFSTFLGLNSCTQNEYEKYRPLIWDGVNSNRLLGNANLDSMEFANTLKVLKYYGEDYKTLNENVILIKVELAEDWELLWNYTTKANDISWLNTH